MKITQPLSDSNWSLVCTWQILIYSGFVDRSSSARSWSCTPPWSPLAYSPPPGSPPLQHEKVCILRTSIRSKWGAWLGSREASSLPLAHSLPSVNLLPTSGLSQVYLLPNLLPTSGLYLLPTGYKLSTALSTSQSTPRQQGSNTWCQALPPPLYHCRGGGRVHHHHSTFTPPPLHLHLHLPSPP